MTDPSIIIGILTIAGGGIGLFLQILSLNSKIRKRAADEQKVLETVKTISDRLEELKHNQKEMRGSLTHIDEKIHDLEINNHKQHEELSVRITKLETLAEIAANGHRKK